MRAVLVVLELAGALWSEPSFGLLAPARVPHSGRLVLFCSSRMMIMMHWVLHLKSGTLVTSIETLYEAPWTILFLEQHDRADFGSRAVTKVVLSTLCTGTIHAALCSMFRRDFFCILSSSVQCCIGERGRPDGIISWRAMSVSFGKRKESSGTC